MQLVDVKCPRCGSPEVKKLSEDMYRCEFCRTEFTRDLDPEDVEAKKTDADVIKQRQYFEHQEKMAESENKQALKKGVLKFIGIFIASIAGLFALIIIIGLIAENSYSSRSSFDYSSLYEGLTFVSSFDEISEEDLKDLKDAFDEYAADYTEEPYSKECDWRISGDLTYETAYILSNKKGEGNMIIFVYKVPWESRERSESREGYIAFKTTDVELMEDGSIKSTYYVSIAYGGTPDLKLPYTHTYTYDGYTSSYEADESTNEYKSKNSLYRGVIKSEAEYTSEEIEQK